MNFKIRSAILFTALVAIILLACYAVIYFSYKNFKEDEFYTRLEQKANTTFQFLKDIKDADQRLLDASSRNAIFTMYNETVIVYDSNYKIIFKSPDTLSVSKYPLSFIHRIVKEKIIRFKDGPSEVVGKVVEHNGHHAVVIASAVDRFGVRKILNLQFILVVSFILGLLVTALLSYFYVKQAFAPIDVLNTQITRISQNRLNERVLVNQSQDELNQLAQNFNKMLDRIEHAFKIQRSFIQHASHELRTPLANLITSCEAALNKKLTVDEYQKLIESLNEEHHKLVEVTNALLLLSQYENEAITKSSDTIRIDEVLFESIEEVQTQHPNHVIKFSMDDELTEKDLTFTGLFILLKTAITNLLRNACKYSTDNEIGITLDCEDHKVIIKILNNGPTIEDDELTFLMQPFFRAKNAGHEKGYGLGLSIANKIITLHGGVISYKKNLHTNTFIISIPTNS